MRHLIFIACMLGGAFIGGVLPEFETNDLAFVSVAVGIINILLLLNVLIKLERKVNNE